MAALEQQALAAIRVLPDHVANQIAAGEVIERPAAVVKELVENSLDAGATRIDVEFSAGGRQLIRVSDNGCGMSAHDATLALERHATSKLREANDLHEIRTMGFRGEALPSIASVSRFILQTRTADANTGSEILIHAGKLVRQRDFGMATGTRIEATQLFNSVPARRKFLKTDATESAHIIQTLRLIAVARPDVAFSLVEDGRTHFRTPACHEPRDRIAEIWGNAFAEQLLELPPVQERDLHIRGLIGLPGNGRASRRELVTIVNQRPVDNRTLVYAMIEAYHTWLPKGRYPTGFLYVELDPARIDVNVHPAKREIKFREEGPVRQAVLRGITQTLETYARHQTASRLPDSEPEPGIDQHPAAQSSGPAPQSTVPQPVFHPRTQPRKPISEAFQARYLSDPSTKHASGTPPAPSPQPGHRAEPIQPAATNSASVSQATPEAETAAQATTTEATAKAQAPVTQATETTAPETVAPASVTPAPENSAPVTETAACVKPLSPAGHWRYLGQLREGQALLENADGLVLLNPHAAHERICYERIRDCLQSSKSHSQVLLLPETFDFDPVTTAALTPWLPLLANAGIQLEAFGRNFFRLVAHPAWLPEKELSGFVQELVEAIRSGKLAASKLALADDWLARTAARRAASAKDFATQETIERLVDDLLHCEQPLNDPAGKPTLIVINQSELKRRLG